MKDLLKEITNKEKQIKLIVKNLEKMRVLRDWLLTELAYTSNAIEGNTLTRKETNRAITQNITTGSKPIKDYLEAKNHADAFEFVLKLSKSSKSISENDVLSLHKQILKGIDEDYSGRYRNVRVRISGSQVILPNALKVPDLMQDFFKWLKASKEPVSLTAIQSHLQFVSIHPFIDGNGRTARLLTNLILLKNGLLPLIIRPRDRKQYINSIEEAQLRGNAQNYEKFMLNAYVRSMDTYIEMFDEQKSDIQTNKLLKISEFAKLAKVPVSTIRYYLRIGKIKPVSKTKGDYMLFSKEQVKDLK
ncbi:Fic family protein [Candidatus Endomicrobiellum devescovinae]|jgi:Fic family protein|uniref:Fic family protein n=1 Tax=Candidatus Endomicrobiellum devescovinae TaxID=3242322 RepID=UPI00359452EB